MTNTPLRDRLIDLAAMETADKETLASLSQEYLDAGASIGTLTEVLVPRDWRFILSQSGQKLEIARREELWREYQSELLELRKWREHAHDESWHESISVDIHELIAKHAKLNRYLGPAEGLGDVYDAIDVTFAGPGAEFNGTIIALSEEFPDGEEDEE